MTGLDPILARGRAAAEARMTSTCTIRRKSGTPTQDEDTGLVTYPWDDIHTDLPCRVKAYGTAYNVESPAQVTVDYTRRELHVPASTTDVSDGDVVLITAGDLTGGIFRILDGGLLMQTTALRLYVEATEKPEGWS